MSEEELIETLKEFEKNRVEKLKEPSKNLFYAIMKIADERDKYKQLIDKIKEYIENTDDFDIEIFDENSGGCLGTDLSKGAKHILELLEEIK